MPKDREEIGGDVPVTYVPARNTVFLALLTGLAEVVGASDLVIGANVQDYSGYPDCRPEFLRAFAEVACLGTRAGAEGTRFAVHAPLLHLSKAGIVRLGASLGVDYALLMSSRFREELAAGRARVPDVPFPTGLAGVAGAGIAITGLLM